MKQVALPLVKEQQKFEFLQVLGQASQALGEYAGAIASYKEYLAHFGTNINILNAIGDCYHQLGDIQEALVAWKKSLEINPNQERIKTLVKSVQEKK